MRRRSFCVAAVVAWGAWILPAGPHTALQATASTGGYEGMAAWLFELYAGQSVRLSITNAIRSRPPGTDQVLAPQIPSMVQALGRHRTAFVTAMTMALRNQIPTTAIDALVDRARVQPPDFDDAARRALFEVDAEFRREAQAVIRAMTADIGLMIATTLAEQAPRPQ